MSNISIEAENSLKKKISLNIEEQTTVIYVLLVYKCWSGGFNNSETADDVAEMVFGQQYHLMSIKSGLKAKTFDTLAYSKFGKFTFTVERKLSNILMTEFIDF